jgi:hypothetical protein
MPLLKKNPSRTTAPAAAVDSVIVDDDTLPAMPSPPAPPRASDFVSNDSDDDEEDDETEEEDEEEEEEEEEDSEEDEPTPPPKKRARRGNDPMSKIAAIAKTLNKKKQELHKRTMNQAIEIISALLDKHATEIADKIENGDFVSDCDGTLCLVRTRTETLTQSPQVCTLTSAFCRQTCSRLSTAPRTLATGSTCCHLTSTVSAAWRLALAATMRTCSS